MATDVLNLEPQLQAHRPPWHMALVVGVEELWPFLLQMPFDAPLTHTNTQRQSAQQRFAIPLRFPDALLVHPWYPFI